MVDGCALFRSTALDHFSSAEPYGAPRYLSHSPWLTGQKVVTPNLCFGFPFFSSKIFSKYFVFRFPFFLSKIFSKYFFKKSSKVPKNDKNDFLAHPM